MSKILLVEDDISMQFLYGVWLDEFDAEGLGTDGTAIDCCNNEREAQNAIKQGNYDLVILDIDLGEGATGLELLHEIAKNHPSLKVLVISIYLNQFPRLQRQFPQYVYLSKEEATQEMVREEVKRLI